MSKKLNYTYGFMHALYWMTYGVFITFASAFLLPQGYSNSDIGLILALGSVLAVFLQPVLADVSDRSSRLSLFSVTNICTLLVSALAAFFFFLKGKSLALSAVFVLLIAWYTSIQSLLNSYVSKVDECGRRLNFGICRSMGSLFYALLCAFLGNLVEKVGISVIPFIGEGILVLLLAAGLYEQRLFNFAMEENLSRASDGIAASKIAEEGKAGAPHGEAEEINLVQFMVGNKTFLLVCAGIFGIYFSNSVFNNFLLQIVTNVGGDNSDMGTIASVMAVLEIPTMMLYERIRRRFELIPLLTFAAFCFFGKAITIFLAPNLLFIYLAHIFQPLSFALFLPGMVEYISSIMSKGEAVKGQTLYIVATTLATIISSAIGGFVIDFLGIRTLVLLSAVLTLAGASIIAVFLRKTGR